MNDQPEQNRADAESPQTAEQDVLRPDEVAERPPKKSMMPPSRIAFLVFVLVAAVAIVVELRARWGYTGTVEALNEAIEKAEQDEGGLYRKDLEQLVCGSPSREYDEQMRRETFTWRGVRTHRLEVQYGQMEFVSSFHTP